MEVVTKPVKLWALLHSAILTHTLNLRPFQSTREARCVSISRRCSANFNHRMCLAPTQVETHTTKTSPHTCRWRRTNSLSSCFGFFNHVITVVTFVIVAESRLTVLLTNI